MATMNVPLTTHLTPPTTPPSLLSNIHIPTPSKAVSNNGANRPSLTMTQMTHIPHLSFSSNSKNNSNIYNITLNSENNSVTPNTIIFETDPSNRKKRTRTITNPFQAKVLRTVLSQTAFPSTEMRRKLALALNMSPRTVQIWFQNQRQKEKAKKSQPTSTKGEKWTVPSIFFHNLTVAPERRPYGPEGNGGAVNLEKILSFVEASSSVSQPLSLPPQQSFYPSSLTTTAPSTPLKHQTSPYPPEQQQSHSAGVPSNQTIVHKENHERCVTTPASRSPFSPPPPQTLTKPPSSHLHIIRFNVSKQASSRPLQKRYPAIAPAPQGLPASNTLDLLATAALRFASLEKDQHPCVSPSTTVSGSNKAAPILHQQGGRTIPPFRPW